MSSKKGEAMETQESAPLDLSVKKAVKAEPKTPEGAPLNLSKPPTPSQSQSISPNLVSKGTGGGSDALRVAIEKLSPARTPRTSYGDHDTLGVHSSKPSAVSPVGDVRNHHHVAARPKMEDHRVVDPAGASLLKHHTSQPPQGFGPPRHVLARGVPQDIPVVGANLPVCGDRNHMIPRGPLPPSVLPGTLLIHTLPGQPGAQAALSPSRMLRHPVPVTSQVHHHHPKLPSPRTGSKKKSPVGPRESTPVHSGMPSSEASTLKTSPSPTKRQSKLEREEHSPHAASTILGIHPMGRLVTHGVSPRPVGAAMPVAVGVSQKSPVSHPMASPPQESGYQRSRGAQPRPTQPTSIPQGHPASRAPHGRGALPQQPRSAPQPPIPPQLSPQHLPGPPPLVHGQMDAMIRLRHPVTSENILRLGARAPLPTTVLPTPRAPLTHPQLTQPTPSHPACAPHTTKQPIVPPAVGNALIGHPPSPHRHPTPAEVHHGRIRHPVSAPGKSYVPKGKEYYLSGPHSHLPPAGPPIAPPPGTTSAPGPTPFAINPFFSLSIAIDCQRATEQDSDGDTALHIAIVQDKPDMGLVRRLIELVRLAGKTIDIFNYMQQTPLHLACIMKDADVIRLLVEAGSNPNEADRNGQTAAHHTCKNGHPGCLGAILRYSQVEVNLNIRNYEGYTPLHLAAMIGNPTLVTMLLEKGADLNSKDSKNGWTPLFHAVTNQDTKLVHKMLSAGAEVNVQSYSGNTVLHVATGRGYTDIVKILVHYGADMSLKNTSWDTPATITTDKKMSNLLRGLGAGSPQTPETASPSTPAPTLPMPLNDAYLIRPPPAAASPSTPSTPTPTAHTKPLPIVTSMTTERLKGPANETYTVTRSVSHPDGNIPSPNQIPVSLIPGVPVSSPSINPRPKSPDIHQRAVHKQMQEKLRQSIQCRKFVNEHRTDTVPKKPEGASGNEKVVVMIPAKKDKEGRISVILPPHDVDSDSSTASLQRTAFLSELEKKVNASMSAGMKVPEESGSPTVSSLPLPSDKSSAPLPLYIAPKTTPDVVPKGDKESAVAATYYITNKLERIVEVGKSAAKETDSVSASKLAPAQVKVNGDVRKEQVSALGTNLVIDAPKELRKEPSSSEDSLKMSEVVTIPKAGSAESDNEIRKRMLSLQYKNSNAILGSRFERKLESVDSEQEREAATAILAMGSAYRERQQQQQEQQRSQTCDADSTVRTDTASPTPVLSSTSDGEPVAKSPALHPPVLEREGDNTSSDVTPDVTPDEDIDDGRLVIDENFASKSRKRTRTPTKSIPSLSPARSAENLDTNVESPKGAGKVKVVGDPHKIWKKARAMMAMTESKRKRKKSEKSGKDS